MQMYHYSNTRPLLSLPFRPSLLIDLQANLQNILEIMDLILFTINILISFVSLRWTPIIYRLINATLIRNKLGHLIERQCNYNNRVKFVKPGYIVTVIFSKMFRAVHQQLYTARLSILFETHELLKKTIYIYTNFSVTTRTWTASHPIIKIY